MIINMITNDNEMGSNNRPKYSWICIIINVITNDIIDQGEDAAYNEVIIISMITNDTEMGFRGKIRLFRVLKLHE